MVGLFDFHQRRVRMRNTFVLGALAALSVWQAFGQEEVRQAMITGRSGGPKCTIEVEVDVVADVEIRGTMGRIHTLQGSPAMWRRFECNVPMPVAPANFRFSGIDGRGRQTLISDPLNNGVAVVRIEDPKSGREGYTFDIEWNGDAGMQGRGPGYQQPGYQQPGYQQPGYQQGPPPDVRNDDNRFADYSVRACSDSAQDQLRRNGYREPRVLEVKMDADSGRGDWIYGKVAGRRGPNVETFGFACSVDFQNRRISPVNLRPSNDGYYGGGDSPRYTKERAVHACQDAVQDRLRNDGYVNFEIRKIDIDDNPGRNDWIMGNLVARRRDNDRDRFEFSCSVDFDGGRIRSINVNRAGWR
jgi:hypothetical protein